MKTAISLRSVSKKYLVDNKYCMESQDRTGDFWALDDVSIDIFEGQVVGLIGRNGAGKTTFLNIAAGVTSPTKGTRSVSGRVASLFSLGVGFQDELTGKENIFLNGTLLGATKEELKSRLEKIIEFSELGGFIDMPLGTYSQGMRLRLGFSIIANLYFDILLIDEIIAVGDTLFQNKCFERLMEFKRCRKTIVLSSQSMDLIERLCDKVVLLNHGRILFNGEPSEGIGRYRALLNTEQFFVGASPERCKLVENTKKWAEDISCWGRELGTKEVIIESVELFDGAGLTRKTIKSRDPLRVKVKFLVRNDIKEPHYGVALFREDGVYCYGPNTSFDGHRIPSLKKGKGQFSLYYDKLLLAPGKYRISVAIWDRDEVVAYDYHDACYELFVGAYDNVNKELINLPYRWGSGCALEKFRIFLQGKKVFHNLNIPQVSFGQKNDSDWISSASIIMLNGQGERSSVFMTNEKATVRVNMDVGTRKNLFLWLGFFRDDGIYCQGLTIPIGRRKDFAVEFPELPLLPGSYFLSLGVWDRAMNKFVMNRHGIYDFRMVFIRKDHGTVYLTHKWELENE
jgi:ABC-type polysaccharide/polyol phosphate transport system ATPase subunit